MRATAEQIQTLLRYRDDAVAAEHVWPDYAACEAVLESAWGTSALAVRAHNIFGQKQTTPPAPPEFETIMLPTKEFVEGHYVDQMARWVKFPSVIEAFRERMWTLRTLRHFYPDYAAALTAPTGEEYVIDVSRKWSTDPERAEKVLEIYRAHADVLREEKALPETAENADHLGKAGQNS